MTYQAQNRKSQQNNNQKRAQSGAPLHRTSANTTRQNRGGSRRAATLPAARNKNTNSLGKVIKNLVFYKAADVETLKAKANRPLPVSAVVMITICTLLLGMTLFSYVQINEYTVEVASLRGELADLEDEKKELDLVLEEKNDMTALQKYAVENLGMVKSDQLTKKHISLEQEDKVEVVAEAPAEDVTVVSGVMSAIGENFKGLWEYME